MPQQTFTAFSSTEANLKDLIRHIDAERFRKEHVPVCSFLSKNCLGACCSLPVAVTQEEAEVLSRLVKDRADVFRKMGKNIRGAVIRIDSRNKRRRLAKRKRSFRELNKIIYNLINKKNELGPLDFRFFSRFTRTCVFAMHDGSCSLQLLAKREGLHKWYYKPFNCWKYPLSIDKGRLTLPEKISSMHFPCSKDKNTPAYQGLQEELSFLGKIVNRDILKEIWFS
ncbi:MAG: hypothetical protein NTW64_01485 [Candidatus Omnitrophica bacterium]|nr:hypothetical protein [Candidatus Omnitrophota bacterium]